MPPVDHDLVERVRTLRERGVAPKAIARAVGLRPAEVAPLLKAIAVQNEANAPERAVVECWVSPGWNSGLAVDGHPDWLDPDADAASGISGLASVLVVRDERRGRVSVCGYLVDAYCLGVKDTVGPRVMDPHALPEFVRTYYSSYEARPLAAPLELAQHLVFGAVEYARGLGFEPHPDFAAAAAHLGPWTGPSAITFGRNGKPLFIEGPRDNAAQVISTLERTVGRGNFDFVVQARRTSAYALPV